MSGRRIVVVSMVFALLLAHISAQAGELAPSISPAELYTRLQQGTAPLIVDVRTGEEFRSGHIPGAINIPHDKIAGHVAELRSEHGVALYCMMGPRARLGEEALRKAGLKNVLHIEGGLSAWRASGLPVEGQ